VREVQTTLPIGTVLQEHYCVEGVLGKGTSGAVYLVSDQRDQNTHDRLFVLKQRIDLNTQKRHQFFFEAVLLRKLSHEALPRVYQVFDDARHGWHSILMEYIEGPSLDTLRQQQPGQRFAWFEAMTIMTPIIEAVGYLHRQQPALIHGDIKPANIIVPKTGTGAMLVDRGFSKEDDPEAYQVVGRAQADLGNDIYTDIYDLGVTLYTLLTGVTPAELVWRMTQLGNEGTDPLKPADEVVPAVPTPVAQVIHHAISLNADDRFASVEQLWAGLQSQVKELAPVPAAPPTFSLSSQAPRQVVTRSATVQSPTPPHAFLSSKPATTSLTVSNQAATYPATVSIPKPSRPAQSSKPNLTPLAAPGQVVTYPATVSPHKPSRPAQAPKPSAIAPTATRQAGKKPATVHALKPSRTSQPSELDTTPPMAPKQAVKKPVSAPAPKPSRTLPAWKLGSLWSIARKQAAEKPAPELEKHISSSTRLPAGKMQNVPVVDNLKREGNQRITGKRQKARRPYFVTCVLLLLLLGTVVSLFSIAEYQTYDAKYHTDLSLARAGIQHLETGVALSETLQKNPLDAPTVQKAQREFAASLMIFSQLDIELKSLPGISLSIPGYGARLSAALHLLPIAIGVSQTGVIACNTLDLLISRFGNPVNTRAQGLTMADFSSVNQNFQRITTLLNQVISQVNRLQPQDLQLDPRLSKIVTTFHKEIPALQAWLDVAEKILPLAPTVFGIGTPTNYLIEILDSTELRPGGGFIDSYGIATLSGGRLTTAPITDVDLLDGPFEAAGGQIPFPAAYPWFDIAPTWSFRDSNLDADFPTAARYAELTYKQEGGKVPVQGVIAVNPTLIRHVLAISGPIDVPEYHETITAQNLMTRIHFYQVGPGKQGNNLTPPPDAHSSGPKHFTEVLAEHFLARIRQLSSVALPKFLQLLMDSLHSKDVQIYLNPGSAEHLLQSYHLDASIQSPIGDGLFVVDANIGVNKANSLITNALNDQVTIDGKGNVVHHTTLRYAWALQGQTYGPPLYQDYVRVYVPPGSVLQTQVGWEPRGTSEAFGREVWAGFFTLSYRQTDTITLIWTAPSAVKKGTSGWDYQYTIQRQAGAQWALHLQVTLPSCAGRITTLGGLVSSSQKVMSLTQSLNGDMDVGVDYAC
jgi:serine/threonine protein kinase